MLDEATSALDAPSEERLFRLLKERLPDTTVVSIGHRPALAALHQPRLELPPSGTGEFMLASSAIVASSARMGSTSVTKTLAPRPRARLANPRPHHP